MRLAIVALLAACGAPDPEPTASPLALAHALTRAADGLIRGWQLDYAHPIASTDDTFARTTALYTQACELGDPRACWRGGIGGKIFDNCIAGDAPSCRYYGDWPPITAPLPGRAARAYRAGERDVSTAELREECDRGLARSCVVYVERAPDARDARAVAAQAIELADEGCRAGLDSDCHVLVDLQVPGAKQLRAMQACLWRADCDRLVQDEEDRRDLFAERAARERACQLTSGPTPCMLLAEAYITERLPEPTPGRGRRLRAWACSQLAAEHASTAGCR